MAEIIDLTVSPRPEIIEISSDRENTPPPENKKRKTRKGKTPNCLAIDSGIGSSAQPSRAHSPSDVHDSSTFHPKSASQSTVDEPGLFFFDGAAPPTASMQDAAHPPESDEGGNRLLLPSHVAIFHDDGPVPVEIIPPPRPSSDDEEYIEYLDYEDRKAPGSVRYFEVGGEDINQPRPSIFKCKNCGAEGDHKTYECHIQICLTCGARDEHSTRSCPISKKCYTCGMKGHINKTCPNRFSAHTPADLHGNCGRCGSTEHKLNECPTLWRIYQYVNDEERILILQSREEKKPLAIGEGGEGYIGRETWCYNCANTDHLGDDCVELPYLATFSTESSAFGTHNVVSGPFYDLAAEPVPVNRGPRDQRSKIDWPRLPDDWDAGAPADVGKQGRNKDRERLKKRFREQEDEVDDWFNDTRNVKKRGTDQRAPPPEPGGKTLKFGLIKDGGHEPSPPPNTNGTSLLARLGDTLGGNGGRCRVKNDGGRERHEPSHQPENSLRIRGAATDQIHQDGKHANRQRGQDRWDRDKLGGSGRGYGPRYRGGYDR